MSQGIENLADLINDAGDGREFFSRNYVTHGMEQLFREGMLRLAGKSDQAVFELTQAMGGGKTHMMIALGLLARHTHLRTEVLPTDLSERIDFSGARIAAFNGRNNPENYIWGEIASQLGEDEIERNAKEVPQPKIDQAFINPLTGILQPERRNAYQEMQVLPRLDELKLSGPRVLIVIRPDGRIPPSELNHFFEFQQEKNNLLVLTGQDSHMADAVEDRLRELYAIEQIHKRLKSGDTLFEEARDRLEEAEERFNKALSAAYNRLYFPSIDKIDDRETLVSATIDNGLRIGQGDQSAEAQIEALLASPRANYKLAQDLTNNFNEYFAMAEEYLWPSGRDNRRTPWKDIAARITLDNPWAYFNHNIKRGDPMSEDVAAWTFPLDCDQEGISIRWRRDATEENKLTLYHKALDTFTSSEEKAALCKRPEEVDQDWLYAPSGPRSTATTLIWA
jgi:hypothetical protein